MQSVMLHVDGAGGIWVIAKCRSCGQVHKYLATEAIEPGVSCKDCKHPMELSGAVIAAAGRAKQGDGDAPGTPDSHAAE